MAVGVHAVAKARLERRRRAARHRLRAGRPGRDRGAAAGRRAADRRRRLLATAARAGGGRGRRRRRRSGRRPRPGRAGARPRSGATRRGRPSSRRGCRARRCARPSSSSASACRACSISSWPPRRAVAHRGGRRVHGGRHHLSDARHHQGAEPPVRPRLHAGRVRRHAPATSRRARSPRRRSITGHVGVGGVAQAFEELALTGARTPRSSSTPSADRPKRDGRRDSSRTERSSPGPRVSYAMCPVRRGGTRSPCRPRSRTSPNRSIAVWSQNGSSCERKTPQTRLGPVDPEVGVREARPRPGCRPSGRRAPAAC